MTNKEAILSKYLSPRHGVVTKENALKAMDEYAASSPSLREALEGLLKIIDDSYGVFDHYEENGAKDTGVTKWAVFKEEIQAARTALEGDGWVRVEDGLPEVGEGHATEVTICSHIGDAKDPMVVVSGVFYNGDFYVCAEWHNGDLDLITPITPGRITHWRPLPTPPTNQVK